MLDECLHEHDLHSNLTTMYKSSYAQMFRFLVKKYLPYLLKKKVQLSETLLLMDTNFLFIHCSRILLVHAHVNIFVTNSPSVPQPCKQNFCFCLAIFFSFSAHKICLN